MFVAGSDKDFTFPFKYKHTVGNLLQKQSIAESTVGIAMNCWNFMPTGIENNTLLRLGGHDVLAQPSS